MNDQNNTPQGENTNANSYSSSSNNGDNSVNNNANNGQPYPPNYYAPRDNDNYAKYYNPNMPGGHYDNNQNYYGEQWQKNQHSQDYNWNFNNMYNNAAQPKKKNKGLRIFGAIAATIVMVVVIGFAGVGIYNVVVGNIGFNNDKADIELPYDEEEREKPSVNIVNKPEDNSNYVDTGLSNIEIFKKVSPSVVGIVSNITQGPQQGTSEGSGIIMSADGYIITNAHVVDGASHVEVVLYNNDFATADIIGVDKQTDLAVVKIEAEDLPFATFGNSDELLVGERVVAIGNPGGMQFALSQSVGYVSGLNRTLANGEAGYALDCIQTDAAINPGNSGGPLINAFGQVIGINSSKINAQEFEGMGFAIPINDAMPIINDLIENGRVTGRAMLGISVSEMDPFMAILQNLPMGIIVRGFSEGNDLEAQGVKINDIITHIEDKPIYSLASSASILKDYKPGDTVKITVYRKGINGKSQYINFNVKLAAS